MPKLPKPPSVAALLKHDAEFATLGQGVVLWRVHGTSGDHVTAWNQLRRFGPIASCRFDPHQGPPHLQSEGVAYLSDDVPTSLAEVFQTTRVISKRRQDPYLTGLRTARETRLLDLTGSWPLRIGASFVINSGRKDHCRLWARAFRKAWPEADGLRYLSSMSGQTCVALFNPAADIFPASPELSEPLAHPGLAALLADAAAQIGYLVV